MASMAPNDVLRLLKERHSILEFTTKKVGKKDLEMIIEAARWAPSVLNSQPWEFHVVRDKEKVEHLNSTIAYRNHVSPPALIIAIVLKADSLAEEYDVTQNKVPMIDAHMSLSMPALQMCLMAHALGIGSCLLTPHKPTAKSILKLKGGDTVPIMVGFGYEPEGSKKTRRERRSTDVVLRYAQKD